MRASARRFMRTAGALSIAVERDAVKLHPMVDEAEAELLGNSLLQRLELIVDELDHISGFYVDKMIVVGFGCGFVARAAVAELVAFENPCFLEQPHGPVDRGD